MDLHKARSLAAELATRLDSELVGLDAAIGRVLAENVRSAVDIPPDARSMWDGIVLDSHESASASPEKPVILNIAGVQVTAGMRPPGRAGSGECFRIMTGAVLPEGTDVVIPFEEAVVDNARLVLTKPPRPGSGAIAPGSDARQDTLLLEAGDILTSTRIAVAAATGANRVRVFRRPRVAVLATGDELRETGGCGEPGASFCNNLHLFSTLVLTGGGEPILLGIAPDDPELILSRMESVGAEMIITTGGMGKGSKDFIMQAWERLGVRTHFHGIALSPGGGSALGSRDGRVFLGLPGNPWAGRIVFEEIAAPMIRKYQGVEGAGDFSLQAETTHELRKKKGASRAVEGSLSAAGGCFRFTPGKAVCNHQGKLSLLRYGMAYALLDSSETHVPAGAAVSVKLPDLPLSAWGAWNP